VNELNIKGIEAKKASYLLSQLSSIDKNKGLKAVANALLINKDLI
jgi:gamma-glutamyl phosphate reductase